jgi:hypothetical protein
MCSQKQRSPRKWRQKSPSLPETLVPNVTIYRASHPKRLKSLGNVLPCSMNSPQGCKSTTLSLSTVHKCQCHLSETLLGLNKCAALPLSHWHYPSTRTAAIKIAYPTPCTGGGSESINVTQKSPKSSPNPNSTYQTSSRRTMTRL